MKSTLESGICYPCLSSHLGITCTNSHLHTTGTCGLHHLRRSHHQAVQAGAAVTATERIERLRAALQALEPTRVEVEDDSHRHRNHAGAADGRGHFKVKVISAHFEGKTRLKRHQLVFAAVGDLMKTDVHALQVEALTPDEADTAARGA